MKGVGSKGSAVRERIRKSGYPKRSEKMRDMGRVKREEERDPRCSEDVRGGKREEVIRWTRRKGVKARWWIGG
jgi:hypothetical protein